MSTVKQQVVDELHKPARKNFKRRRVVIKGLNDLFQADLVEMIPYAKFNRGFKYILVVINAFSKFTYARPLKNKTSHEVTKAMNSILSEIKVTPKNLQTDQGKEFFNTNFATLMKKYKINHYATFSNLKASIVERCNRTLKNLMWKRFSLQGTYKWINILDEILHKYNTTVHSTTGFKPSKVTKKNEKDILNSAYTHLKILDMKTKFKVGDHVRISKYRHAFSKGYTPNWSNEVFKIRKVNLTYPTTYLIQDHKGDPIQGGFYHYELQKVKHPDVYLVEKILRRKGNQVYVQWLGMDKSHNSWIDKSNIL